MTDSTGRKIQYMRISITDRCNLRCSYCQPTLPLSHHNILRYEEILRVCEIITGLGIHAFRVTGGEPLVRKGCVDFLRKLKSLPGVSRLSLTTNGVLLEPYVNELAQTVDGINISLDSINTDTYRKITGTNGLDAVLQSLHSALNAGHRVKINCVPMRGINDSEIIQLAQLAEKFPIDVRFIEYMPTTANNDTLRVAGSEILRQLSQEYSDLQPNNQLKGQGPARYYKSAKMQGSIGIITAIDNCFCADCNRVRLTSQGFLKLCLFHDDGVDLRTLLHGETCDSEIEAAISRAISQKPGHHRFGKIKNMSQIGG